VKYDAATAERKGGFKEQLLERLQLPAVDAAPLVLWPVQPGTAPGQMRLLTETLPRLLGAERKPCVRLAILLEPGQDDRAFTELKRLQGPGALSVGIAREETIHLAYAAADFVLAPSPTVSCNEVAMIALRYGALPIVFSSREPQEVVRQLRPGFDSQGKALAGNGFIAETDEGFEATWREALQVFGWPPELRQQLIKKVMRESADELSCASVAAKFAEVYHRMWRRPLCA
jgi:glycogen synthase